MLKTLQPEQWQHHGIHSERGHETIQHIVTMYAGHDLNHLKQIEAIVAATKKSQENHPNRRRNRKRRTKRNRRNANANRPSSN